LLSKRLIALGIGGGFGLSVGNREDKYITRQRKIETQIVVMIAPEETDPVDALLREQNVYVEDGGFTVRIVKSLPRRRRAWLRPTLLLSATAVGAALAVLWLPWGNLPALDLSALQSLNSKILLPWTLVITVGGTLIWSTIAALQRED
jgi:hypothetical protein